MPTVVQGPLLSFTRVPKTHGPWILRPVDLALSWWVIFCLWGSVKAVGSCFWRQVGLSRECIGADDYNDLLFFSFVMAFSFENVRGNTQALFLPFFSQGSKERGVGNSGLKQAEWTKPKWDSLWLIKCLHFPIFSAQFLGGLVCSPGSYRGSDQSKSHRSQYRNH